MPSFDLILYCIHVSHVIVSRYCNICSVHNKILGLLVDLNCVHRRSQDFTMEGVHVLESRAGRSVDYTAKLR